MFFNPGTITHQSELFNRAYPNGTYLTGTTLNNFIEEITDPTTLLTLFLAIAYELNRIHILGILHGDIQSNNVIASFNKHPTIATQFINFQNAYSINDLSAITTKDKSKYWWAPERIRENSHQPAPDTAQDIFSLGRMLLELIQKYQTPAFDSPKRTRLTSSTLFSTSLANTQHIDPSKRPSLNNLIERMKIEIKPVTSCTII